MCNILDPVKKDMKYFLNGQKVFGNCLIFLTKYENPILIAL